MRRRKEKVLRRVWDLLVMLVLLWIELLCNSSKPEKERNVIHMFDIVCIVGHGCRLHAILIWEIWSIRKWWPRTPGDSKSKRWPCESKVLLCCLLTTNNNQSQGLCDETSKIGGSPLVNPQPQFHGMYIIEGSLEVKLPTIWTDEKQSREEAERRERVEERRSEKRKNQKKADADARKGRKVAKHCVFPMIWGSGGSKSRLAKAAGAETSGEMRDEKLHAVVARSRFRSEKIPNPSAPDHFWKLRCWKSARHCGAKHIWK